MTCSLTYFDQCTIAAHETVAVAKAESLIYYRGRSMITHDPTTSRFNIQGILRECLDVYFTIKDLPGMTLLYSRLIDGQFHSQFGIYKFIKINFETG